MGGFFDDDLPKLKLRLEEIDSGTNWKEFVPPSLLKERSDLEKLITLSVKVNTDIEAITELPELTTQEDINNLQINLKALQRLLIPPMPEDSFGVFLDINAGAGGTESQDLVSVLLRMYTRWAEANNVECSVIDQTDGEVAGYKSISLHMPTKDTFGKLKHESGVMRFIRNSPFNAQGKRQTSFCSVLVTPDLNESAINITINHDDYERDMFRSGGKGGQAVNKKSSACRLTHCKTGIIVKCQMERSQNENFRIAMNMLKGRLFLLEKEKKSSEFKQKYENDKRQVAFGHQIRTYVYSPDQLVKDERTGIKTSDLTGVLNGEWIDRFNNAE